MTDSEDDLTFVINSRYRVLVLSNLADNPSTPSRISAEEDINYQNVSHALSCLCERGFVELLVSDERRKGRIYGITETGEHVFQKLDEHDFVRK